MQNIHAKYICKIYLQNIYANIYAKYIFKIYMQNIFSKYICKIYLQNIFAKIHMYKIANCSWINRCFSEEKN